MEDKKFYPTDKEGVYTVSDIWDYLGLDYMGDDGEI